MKYLRNNLSIRIRNIFLITCILLIVAFLTVFRSQNKDVQFAESLTTTKKSSSTEKSIKDHKDYLFYDSILYKNYTREYVIEETIKFANRGVEEDDPELIQFVQKLIKPPSNIKYNFANPNKPNSDYSQDGQSVYIDELLKKRTDGFYIGKLII